MGLNERKTENLVRLELKNLGYYKDKNIVVEEQKSDNPKIDKLLKHASKKGMGKGFPEFIIHNKTKPDFLIVIECKPDIRRHKSENLDKYSEYAVDGALLYASFLSREYDVLAIGVSGETKKNSKIDHYLHIKGNARSHKIFGTKFLEFENYFDGYKKDETKKSQDYEKMLSFSKKLNDFLRDKKIKEKKRSLLISGILISLNNEVFKSIYKKKTGDTLNTFLINQIYEELEKGNVFKPQNIEQIKDSYNFIKHDFKGKTDILKEIIDDLLKNVKSFIETHKYFDALSEFYVEFLRYANNDKSLGIVLTPPHIADLFTELAEVNENSIVVDSCAGTGSFLISSMRRMIKQCKGDTKKEKEIQEKQIIGIEDDSEIYSLAVSNMFIHGDGKSNIIKGDCFNEENINKIKSLKANVGFLNPPYSLKEKKELEFVLNNLEMLEKNSTCICIVPMSCFLKESIFKEIILKKHTLEAVLSMPDELFHNSGVNTVTAVAILKAHTSHPKGKKTWFAFCKDDGFFKKKTNGRFDYDNKWENIKNKWVKSFRNKSEEIGFSLLKEVKSTDEWCVEAYMETDYSKLTDDDFIKTIRSYVAYKFLQEQVPNESN